MTKRFLVLVVGLILALSAFGEAPTTPTHYVEVDAKNGVYQYVIPDFPNYLMGGTVTARIPLENVQYSVVLGMFTGTLKFGDYQAAVAFAPNGSIVLKSKATLIVPSVDPQRARSN